MRCLLDNCIWGRYCQDLELGPAVPPGTHHAPLCFVHGDTRFDVPKGVLISDMLPAHWTAFMRAAVRSQDSPCVKAHFGAIIETWGGARVGRGFNLPWHKRACAPCLRQEIPSRLEVEWCNAIHAEQMALLNVPSGSKPSVMYLWSANERDVPLNPYFGYTCTVCAKMALWAGVEVILKPLGVDRIMTIPSELFMPTAMTFVAAQRRRACRST